ncbi:MAG: type I-C CRISPR-associated protein Cas7/Csd2 [Peptostreptococcaceae bacterium]|nr:type I-C CRISPR-associated protein Cas7/Csd2 [Peptostreptococcaceae bacterium]
MSLKNKIDFVVFFTVTKANPNGDPLNGNRPRIDFEGYGEVSDVCIKRKIRNRWMDMEQNVFVQSDSNCKDGFKSLRERWESNPKVKDGGSEEELAQIACEEWIDIRGFGQVLAFKSKASKGVSIGVRGPISIHTATSLDKVEVNSMQITKSVNSESTEKGTKSSDTMGMKHRIDFGVYKLCGSINVQLAEKTGFSQEDAELLKEALCTLFENDASSARPEGAIEVNKVYWFEHKSKTGELPTAKIHHGIKAEVVNEGLNSFERYAIKEDHWEGFEKKEVTTQLTVYKAR